jgi:microcystin-dependent protein
VADTSDIPTRSQLWTVLREQQARLARLEETLAPVKTVPTRKKRRVSRSGLLRGAAAGVAGLATARFVQPESAQADASGDFIGEIVMFGFNFAPVNYALCQGQIQSIQQNAALFSILGTDFGGNGQTTFGLPDLRGRVPLGVGQGPGLSPYVIGEQSGTETVTVLSNEIPSHNHLVNCVAESGDRQGPGGNIWAAEAAGVTNVYSDATPNATTMGNNAIGLTGGSQPHENRQPFLVINFCICMFGIFPSRS